MASPAETTSDLARCRRIVTNPDLYQDAPAQISAAFTRLRLDHEARRINRMSRRHVWPIVPGGVA